MFIQRFSQLASRIHREFLQFQPEVQQKATNQELLLNFGLELKKLRDESVCFFAQ